MTIASASQDEPDHPQQHDGISIAIIGAGYAGLALANLLIHDRNKKDPPMPKPTLTTRTRTRTTGCSFVLFEALHPPSPLGGDVCIPHAKHLYEALGWEWTFESDERIPEEALLQDLRRTPQIEYHHVCYKIEHDEEYDYDTVPNDAPESSRTDGIKLSLLIWNRKTDECVRYPSTFDVVIICNGVFRSKQLLGPILEPMPFNHYLPFRNTSTNNLQQKRQRQHQQQGQRGTGTIPDDRILLLGDARWSPWWDFGRHRITKGANQALHDAMQVHQLLQQQLVQISVQVVLPGQGISSFLDWGKFGIANKRQEIVRFRFMILWMIIFLLLPVMIFCDITSRTKQWYQ